MFDYEQVAGQAFMKGNRLKSYEWTGTGIKFTILDINRNLDQGKYEGEVAAGLNHKQNIIEVGQFLGK